MNSHSLPLVKRQQADPPHTAAIACGIALSYSPDRTDDDVPDAVEAAVRYVEAGIRTGFDLGRGNGPINHFHSLSVMRVPAPFPSTLKRSVYGKGVVDDS